MQKTYSTSDIGAHGQVVVVHFQDGISFEVAPVFLNNRVAIHTPTSTATAIPPMAWY